MIEAVIFDLDGVVADTEPLHTKVESAMLRELGVVRDQDLGPVVGMGCQEVWDRRIAANGLVGQDSAALKDRQFLRVLEAARAEGLGPSKGLLELLDLLRSRGIRTAVASSSDLVFVEGITRLFGIRDRFDALVGGDMVANLKPAPDPYQKAMELIGARPGTSLAVEDSAVGIRAALAAGMFCCGYRNPTSGSQDLSAANRQISHLMEIAELL